MLFTFILILSTLVFIGVVMWIEGEVEVKAWKTSIPFLRFLIVLYWIFISALGYKLVTKVGGSNV